MKIMLFLFSIIVYSSTLAQVENKNIVKNPSFEDHFSCPKKRNKTNAINSLPDWSGYMTPDHFSMCSKQKTSVPINFAGVMMPADGKSYAGIIVNSGKNNYTEFLKQQLSTPLIKGQWYCCKFYCAKALNAKIATQSPQIMFNRKDKFNAKKIFQSYHKTNRKFNILAKQSALSANTKIVENTTSWTLVCGTYQAAGNETNFYIGKHNLEDDPYSLVNGSVKSTLNSAYYLIDNVSIVPILDPTQCNCTKDSLITNPIYDTINDVIIENVDTFILPTPIDPVVLEHIIFNTSEAKLLPQSDSVLNYLLNLLITHPNIKIQITGHTDNTGLEKQNIKLSEKRALAVTSYL
ncbi:MAG: OmpA family protein, partial [Vicingaceae bacterium]